MIVSNSEGREKDIALLLKEVLQYDDNQVRAWMLCQYDPSSMFCLFHDSEMAGFLQSFRRTFFFNGRRCEAVFLTKPVLKKEYDSAIHSAMLWNAALDQAEKSSLLTFYRESNPQEPYDSSFSPVSMFHNYNISLQGRFPAITGTVRPYGRQDDLYELYKTFISNFDGCFVLSKKQFDDRIRWAKASGAKVMVYLNNKKVEGMYIAYAKGRRLQIETILYASPDALVEMLIQAAQIWKDVDLCLSGSENLQSLMQTPAATKDAFMVRINHLPLFNRWQSAEFEDYSQAFNSLDLPSWNNLV